MASITITKRWGGRSWLCTSEGIDIPSSDTDRPLHVEAPSDGEEGKQYSLDLSTLKLTKTRNGGFALTVDVKGLKNKHHSAHVTLGFWNKGNKDKAEAAFAKIKT